MHLTSGYDIANELALNKLWFDEPLRGYDLTCDVIKSFSYIYDTIYAPGTKDKGTNYKDKVCGT